MTGLSPRLPLLAVARLPPKPFPCMGDMFQAELAVVLGVEGVVGIGESREMVVEDKAQDICPPRNIGGGACGRDREGR